MRSLQQIHFQRILSRDYCSAHMLGGCLGAGKQRCAVGTLLACGRVHHHLVRTQMRSRVGLLLESAEAREVTLLSPNAPLSDGAHVQVGPANRLLCRLSHHDPVTKAQSQVCWGCRCTTSAR